MLIEYDDGPDEMVIPSAGNLVVPRGVPTDVPDEVAGTVPGPWAPVGAPNWDSGLDYRNTDEGGWEVRTPGTGLLAQSAVWHLPGGEG